MATKCISSCVDDARVPVRATYVNLYKWPESDFEFVRSMSLNSRRDGRNPMYGHPRVVDSFSCRQTYLRSYTFSREEDYRDERTIKCLGGRGREKAVGRAEKRNSGSRRCRDGEPRKLKKAKSASCSALAAVFRRLLSCTTEVNVAN